jgi:hypothetical protein
MRRRFVPSGFTGNLTILPPRFSVSDAELDEYKNAHVPKPAAGVSAHKEDQEF